MPNSAQKIYYATTMFTKSDSYDAQKVHQNIHEIFTIEKRKVFNFVQMVRRIESDRTKNNMQQHAI